MNSFLDYLAQQCLTPAKTLTPALDGKVHRFDIEGRLHGKKHGWYVGHDAGDYQLVNFGDWQTGAKGTWCSKQTNTLSEAEKESYKTKLQELRKIADSLDVSEERIASIYEDGYKKRGKEKSRDEIKALMQDETWYTAQQALDAGLIDAIEGQAVEPVAAKYRNMPAAMARQAKAGDRTPYPFAREAARLRLRKNS